MVVVIEVESYNVAIIDVSDYTIAIERRLKFVVILSHVSKNIMEETHTCSLTRNII